LNQVKLVGLTAATHTPFDVRGDVDLSVIELQANHLLENRVHQVFVCGSTGESHSLNLGERMAIAERWSDVIRGTELRMVVHVGTNCLTDAQALASQAEKCGATAVSALAPSYFKPKSLDVLIDCVASIAAKSPRTPFYFYDIPVLTGVHFSMPEFLGRAAARIPNLCGIKFTNPDLMAYQQCLRADSGKWDIPFGCDEFLLAALSLGGTGAVGSTYNFAAPIYHRLIRNFQNGDLPAARDEQFRSVRLVELLSKFGFMGAAKSVMAMLGVSVGPPRLPHTGLDAEQSSQLRTSLESMGFFDWIAHA
jgi:N-acetylneuraminate lyase